MSLSSLPVWQKLQEHAAHFSHDNAIIHDNYSILAANSIHLNYQNQLIDNQALALMIELAHACHVPDLIEAQMTGHTVNNTENRPALHTALRSFENKPIYVNNEDIMPQIVAARHQMQEISEMLRAKLWLGYTGKPITDIVNLGIGGSYLGPQFTLHALSESINTDLSFHFIANNDPHEFRRLTEKLSPDTTLFIVSSKSFTTKETLLHMNYAINWLNQPQYIAKHFIAVTSNIAQAKKLGFENIIPIWSWIGGRFSVCSAINLITCIAIGFTAFTEFLLGANAMDQHVLSTDLKNNLPVMLALLGIWNNNFLNNHNLLLLTYAQDLKYFPEYIQQLDMESNGKSIDKNGLEVNYATGPLVWGGLGNQAQHSYYQLLNQGTHKITADLLSIDTYKQDLVYHMCLAHKEVLSMNKASINHISLKDSSPFTIGALISAYEHKIYIQGIIWNINSFDQPGVESAKILMNKSIQEATIAAILD